MDQNHPNNQSNYYPNVDRQAASQGSIFSEANFTQATQQQESVNADTNVNRHEANQADLPSSKESAQWVRFNTICNKELVDKVRAIADTSHCSIRDVVELMFRRGIKAYESKNGIITLQKKKPLEELF